MFHTTEYVNNIYLLFIYHFGGSRNKLNTTLTSTEHIGNCSLCASRVCVSLVCKHAHDAATVTENVSWMLEAGVQLREAAFECVDSRYQRDSAG